jgi:hypothetical protein
MEGGSPYIFSQEGKESQLSVVPVKPDVLIGVGLRPGLS